MTENFDALSVLENWFQSNELEISRTGRHAEFTKSPSDRPNPSAKLVIESDQRIGQITAWSSGETAVELAEVESGSVSDQHRKVISAADLKDMAETLLEWAE